MGAGPSLAISTENVARKIQIQRSGHLNLYLLLDASKSVSEEDFEIFKQSASSMVDRVRNRCQGLPGPLSSLVLRPTQLLLPGSPPD